VVLKGGGKPVDKNKQQQKMRRKPMTNKKLYYVFGMCRSGLHVISHWILHSIGDNCAFFDTYSSWGRQRNYLKLPLSQTILDNPFFPFKDGLHIDRDGTIFLYEDHNPIKLSQCPDPKHIIGQSESIQRILILRDPYNLAASRVRCDIRNNRFHEFSNATRMWKEQAEMFLNPQDDLVPIKYNQWVSDKQYRQEIASRLDIPFVDEIDYVSSHGGGSSFDKLSYQGKGSQMKVFDRWRIIKDVYPDLFADPHIKKLSQQIFGFFPGTSLTFSESGV